MPNKILKLLVFGLFNLVACTNSLEAEPGTQQKKSEASIELEVYVSDEERKLCNSLNELFRDFDEKRMCQRNAVSRVSTDELDWKLMSIDSVARFIEEYSKGYELDHVKSDVERDRLRSELYTKKSEAYRLGENLYSSVHFDLNNDGSKELLVRVSHPIENGCDSGGYRTIYNPYSYFWIKGANKDPEMPMAGPVPIGYGIMWVNNGVAYLDTFLVDRIGKSGSIYVKAARMSEDLSSVGWRRTCRIKFGF